MDTISKKRRSQNMTKIRSINTSPERIVQKIVKALRYKFSTHSKTLPGKPDVIFRQRKKAIYVHGCFWHQHAHCMDGRMPKSNKTYWKEKLARNIIRDRLNRRQLKKMGWNSLIIWECDTKNPDITKRKIQKFVKR